MSKSNSKNVTIKVLKENVNLVSPHSYENDIIVAWKLTFSCMMLKNGCCEKLAVFKPQDFSSILNIMHEKINKLPS